MLDHINLDWPSNTGTGIINHGPSNDPQVFNITMNVACQCGSIAFRTPTPAPVAVYLCHCNECRRQSSSAFGVSATFPAADLPPLSDPALRARLGVWSRATKSGTTIDCYFCKTCGARIVHHGRSAQGVARPTANIKGGLIEGLSLEGASHIWAREAVVPIPAGAVSWPESPPPA
ncbi:hypothetical protein VDGE_02292 [Verticillium dahliae]|uniref:CENP-V/GFA domain-containing protein n=1 Tax=Verticillium dahliae TaxID=27337 RepID=A0A444RM02_VERDA|nr:hypothetical protein VDGE_02292 [Verticillium dahliae]